LTVFIFRNSEQVEDLVVDIKYEGVTDSKENNKNDTEKNLKKNVAENVEKEQEEERVNTEE